MTTKHPPSDIEKQRDEVRQMLYRVATGDVDATRQQVQACVSFLKFSDPAAAEQHIGKKQAKTNKARSMTPKYQAAPPPINLADYRD